MSQSAQALYFHLSMDADDDGIVEAWRIVRMVNANEGDFKALADNDFVKILNDDLVSFITDWHEHNLIRADRKVDSMYKKLLVAVAPDIKLIKARKRADTNEITHFHDKSYGRPLDCERTAQVRIGKVRLGKDNTCRNTAYKIWIDEIIKLFSEQYAKVYDVAYAFNKGDFDLLASYQNIDAVEFSEIIARWFHDEWGKKCGYGFKKMLANDVINRLRSEKQIDSSTHDAGIVVLSDEDAQKQNEAALAQLEEASKRSNL